MNNHFTEANAWQYGFFAPHDVAGHMALLGGPDAYARKLDSLFTAPDRTTGRNQADITGLIGQYAHGNEPSHHVAYLYTFAGQGAKTQRLVRTILDSLYAPTPEGLPGNEDCGQMSAWFVMSALGLYPVTPGLPQYAVGTPLFDRAVVKLPAGRRLTITANPSAGPYVSELRLNGRPYSMLSIGHATLVPTYSLVMPDGKSITTWEPGHNVALDFRLSASPTTWGEVAPQFQGTVCAPCPPEIIRPCTCGPGTILPRVEDWGFVPAPVIEGAQRSFKDRQAVAVRSLSPGLTLRYTRDGAPVTAASPAATGPIEILETGTLRAAAFDAAGHRSGETVATFTKRPNSWALTLGTDYSPQYTGGGPEALIDGIRGVTDWRKGAWQGYYGQDAVATLDFGAVRPVRAVHATFLQDTRPWIVLPRALVVEASADGQQWREVTGARRRWRRTTTRRRSRTSAGRSRRPWRRVFCGCGP